MVGAEADTDCAQSNKNTEQKENDGDEDDPLTIIAHAMLTEIRPDM